MSTLSYRKLLSTLLHFLGKDKKKFIVWNIPIVLSNILSLVEPLFIGLIIDFFTKYSVGQPLDRFYLYLGGLLVSNILAGIMRVAARGAMFEITADLEYTVKTKGFENVQNNSLAWQQGENSGNKVQRIETGKTALIDFIELIKNDLYSTVVNLVGIFAIFIAINPVFLVFFVVYAILQFLLHRYWNKKNPEYLTRLNAAKELSIGKLFEGLNNIQTIKSLGAATSFQSSINTSQNELREATKAWERLGVYKWTSVNIFDICFVVAFFVLVGQSVISGAIGVGFIFVLYTYFGKLQSTTFNITSMWNKLVQIRSNVERMLPLFETVIHNRGNKSFPTKWQLLKLENASFEYETNDNIIVFQNINLSIEQNSFIGITGESGSGKSSLIKVLLGLYPLKSGAYSVGNINFYDIASEEVLENMTVVLQETELFNVSLLENITMFKEVNAALLETAIKVSYLDDVIKSLPNGLDTVIGEKGIKLSGGQRQRIGIARAIYKDAQILLLDEATSNLDYETEKKVVEGIINISKEKTIIAIAHRTSTLEKASKVYKFESGKLINLT